MGNIFSISKYRVSNLAPYNPEFWNISSWAIVVPSKGLFMKSMVTHKIICPIDIHSFWPFIKSFIISEKVSWAKRWLQNCPWIYFVSINYSPGLVDCFEDFFWWYFFIFTTIKISKYKYQTVWLKLYPQLEQVSSSNFQQLMFLRIHVRTHSTVWPHQTDPIPNVHFLFEWLSWSGFQINTNVDNSRSVPTIS